MTAVSSSNFVALHRSGPSGTSKVRNHERTLLERSTCFLPSRRWPHLSDFDAPAATGTRPAQNKQAGGCVVLDRVGTPVGADRDSGPGCRNHSPYSVLV